MHFQVGEGIGKLVRCARGEIYDVVVDLRAASPTLRQWEGFELDDRRPSPAVGARRFRARFLHGERAADVIYKQTGYYDPGLERSVAWNDPDMAIEWPPAAAAPLLSAKDSAAPRLRELADQLPFVYETSDAAARPENCAARAPAWHPVAPMRARIAAFEVTPRQFELVALISLISRR